MIVSCDAGIEASSGKLGASKHGDGVAMHGFELWDVGSQFFGQPKTRYDLQLTRGRQEGKEEEEDQRLQLSRTHGFICALPCWRDALLQIIEHKLQLLCRQLTPVPTAILVSRYRERTKQRKALQNALFDMPY